MAKKRPVLLADCYELYLLDAKARRVTTATLRTYDDRIKPFIVWYNGQGLTTLESVTAAHARAYLIHLQERQLSSYTINGIGRALRAFFNFCVAEKLISESPMARVKVPKVDKRIPPSLSAEDVAKLVDACKNRRDEALVLFLVDTGVRSAELCALNVGDVDTATGAITVTRGKGRKTRNVYLGDRSRKALARYLMERSQPAAAAPLFIFERGEDRLTDSGLRQALERLGQAANVKNVTPHTMHRTFALWALRAGMSIYHLQALMGHADMTVLKHYLALVESDAAEAHAEHGPVDKLFT